MSFYTFLPKLINMSLTASVVIALVLAARFALKRAPKVVSYALWSIVLIRLLCPVSIESNFSLFGLMDVPVEERGAMTSAIEYVPNNIVHAEHPTVALPVPGVSEIINDNLPHGEEQIVADPLEAPVAIVTYVWIVGVLGMVAYAAISYLRLRRQLLTAIHLRDNIWTADEITSPFVMGLFRPKIYLPSSMEQREQPYIILHEQHHIRRLDHIWKALAFVALCIHWFNPLVWIAFIMAGKDMEMSCDEAVVKKMGEGVLADYTASLLSLATGRHIIAGMPLAFGEGDTKGRIRNLANWRMPAFWVILVAMIACVVLAVMLLTNPSDDELHAPEPFGHSYKVEEILYSAPQYSFDYSIDTAPRYQFTADYAMFVSGDILDDTEAVEWMPQRGGFEEVKITTENFDNYFEMSGFRISNDTWSKFRYNINKAWRIDIENDENNVFYYLISTKTEEVYLTYGYHDPEGKTDPNSNDSSIRWLFKLTMDADNATVASPDSQSIKWTYSPMMSATWHGFFQFHFDLPMDIRVEASCDNGTLHNLSESGQPRGKVMRFENGQPVCWSPVIDDDWSETAEDAAIGFTVYNGEELLCSGTLNISRTSIENGHTLYEAALSGTDLMSLQQKDNSAVVVPSDHAAILAYTDLNHNGVGESVIVSEVHPGGMLYELRVEEKGEVIWSTDAAPAHVGWDTIMLYSNSEGDHLVQYQPSMFQGMGNYTCTVFSLEDNKQTVKNEWTVDFNAPFGEETAEMKKFAEEVGLLLRNCYVLLSTEQGITVTQYTSAADLPQLYPVRFDPEEIQAAIDGSAQAQELTANAAQLPSEPLELLFASGAGGWGTVLTLNPDGSFTGVYEDSDMGSGNETYSNGVRRICEFEGKFTDIKQISDYAWSMQMTDLTTEHEVESTWVEDETLCIASDPYGMADGGEFILYAPGTPADYLSPGCRDWWPDAFLWRAGEKETIDGWCLCNVNTGHGFFS